MAENRVDEWLKLGHLRFEKCELTESRLAFEKALEEAKKNQNAENISDALMGLTRYAVETRNEELIARLEKEVLPLTQKKSSEIPPSSWYSLGAIYFRKEKIKKAESYFLKFIQTLRKKPKTKATRRDLARGYLMVAWTAVYTGKLRRAEYFARMILNQFEKENLSAVNGSTYLLLGGIFEQKNELEKSFEWYQRSQMAFMREHHWYYLLYVFYAYARIARLQKNFTQAKWYLDLAESAASGHDFGHLQKEIESEKERLLEGDFDLIINADTSTIGTREKDQIHLGKQFVLVEILRELYVAHEAGVKSREKGLTKSEIIEKVWKEKYQSRVHDNKLYFNINRLRRVLEPHVQKPKYLLNSKAGYRLAPNLKIHFISEAQKKSKGDHST